MCRQFFAKDPLPSGAKRALREFREAERRREAEQVFKKRQRMIVELINTGKVTGKAAEALCLYTGIRTGKRRTYREVGKLMNLSGERVRQLLVCAKDVLAIRELAH